MERDERGSRTRNNIAEVYINVNYRVAKSLA